MTRSRSPPSPASHRCPTPSRWIHSPRSPAVRRPSRPRWPPRSPGPAPRAVWPRCGPPTAAPRAAVPATTWPCTTGLWCGWWHTAPRSACPRTSSRPTSCSPGCSGCSRPSTGSTPTAVHGSRATPCRASAARCWTSCVRRTGCPARSGSVSARPSGSANELAMHLRRTASEREVADALGMPLRELRSNTAARTLSVEQLRSGADGGSLDMLACAGPDPAVALQEQETRRQLVGTRSTSSASGDRLVLRMYYLEDRTLAEIGQDARRHRVAGQPAAQPSGGPVAHPARRARRLRPARATARVPAGAGRASASAAGAGRGSCPARGVPPSAGRPSGRLRGRRRPCPARPPIRRTSRRRQPGPPARRWSAARPRAAARRRRGRRGGRRTPPCPRRRRSRRCPAPPRGPPRGGPGRTGASARGTAPRPPAPATAATSTARCPVCRRVARGLPT